MKLAINMLQTTGLTKERSFVHAPMVGTSLDSIDAQALIRRLVARRPDPLHARRYLCTRAFSFTGALEASPFSLLPIEDEGDAGTIEARNDQLWGFSFVTSGVTAAGQEFAMLSSELPLKREALVQEVWGSLPLSFLRGYHSFYNDLPSWASDNGAFQFQPPTDAFTVFLTVNMGDAPTAAAACLSKAEMCCQHLLLGLPVEDRLDAVGLRLMAAEMCPALRGLLKRNDVDDKVIVALETKIISTTTITHEPQPVAPPSVRALAAFEDVATLTKVFAMFSAASFLQLTCAALGLMPFSRRVGLD